MGKDRHDYTGLQIEQFGNVDAGQWFVSEFAPNRYYLKRDDHSAYIGPPLTAGRPTVLDVVALGRGEIVTVGLADRIRPIRFHDLPAEPEAKANELPERYHAMLDAAKATNAAYERADAAETAFERAAEEHREARRKFLKAVDACIEGGPR